jgi:hypothetical protein
MNFAKPRQAGSFEEAAMQLCVEIGSDQLGKLVERSANLVQKWTDEDSDAIANLKQALKCDLAYLKQTGKEPPFFSAYQAQLRQAESEGSSIKFKSIMDETMDLPGAIGEVTNHVRDFMSDGSLTPRERNILLKAIKDGRQELDDLERAIKATVA